MEPSGWWFLSCTVPQGYFLNTIKEKHTLPVNYCMLRALFQIGVPGWILSSIQKIVFLLESIVVVNCPLLLCCVLLGILPKKCWLCFLKPTLFISKKIVFNWAWWLPA